MQSSETIGKAIVAPEEFAGEPQRTSGLSPERYRSTPEQELGGVVGADGVTLYVMHQG